MHGGEIGVDHLEGAGSISHFTLPAIVSNRAPAGVNGVATAERAIEDKGLARVGAA
jgi:hypothetical protein